jgi:hypothetical protein
LDPRFEQRASEVAVAVRAALRGTRVGHDFSRARFYMWTLSISFCYSIVDGVHKAVYLIEEE